VPAGEWHGFENDGEGTVVTLHLFGGAANLEEAGLEELAGLGSSTQLGGGKAVKKVELSSTPEDASLSAGDGWFGLHVRWLLNSETVGARKLTMNVTAFDPSGAHELHRHDGCEEILYIIEGRGTHLSPEGETRVEQGDATFVRANEWHGFRNDPDVVTSVVGCYAGAGSLSDAGYELPSSR
jgi:quercetin dioxygenase-like cupin family protein